MNSTVAYDQPRTYELNTTYFYKETVQSTRAFKGSGSYMTFFSQTFKNLNRKSQAPLRTK